MSENNKKDAIFKMFLCFPSATKLDRETAGMMTAAYLETVQSFSLAVVSNACDALRRRKEPFPPSAGELYDQCASIVDGQKRAEAALLDRRIAMPRLPPPKPSRFSHVELSDWEKVINGDWTYVDRNDASGNPLVIPPGYPGAGKPTYYGYLTPKEARAYGKATQDMREILR